MHRPHPLPSRSSISPLLVFLFVLALLWAAPYAAASTEVPASQLKVIEAARGTLESADLTQAQRTIAQVQLDAAAALEKEADTLAEQLAELQAKTPTAATQTVEALTPEERQNQLRQWSARLPKNADAEALEFLLQQERSALDALKTRINNSANELSNLIASPGQRLGQVAALRQRADSSAGEAPLEPGEAAALQEARRLRRAAEHRRALAELALYEAEQATAQARQRQLENQLQSLRQEQTLRTPRIEWLTQRINASRLMQLQEQVRVQSELAQGSVAQADAALLELAERNAELAEQLLSNTQSLTAERQSLAEYERTREQITTMARDTQARLRLGTHNAAIGYWLWQQRQDMPSLLALGAQRTRIQQNLGQLRLELYDQSEARFALGNQELGDSPASSAPTAENTENTENAETPESPAAPVSIAATGAAWRSAQAGLIDQYEQLLRRRISVLEQTDSALQTILTRGQELRLLMDQQLLWIPSHQPIGAQWLVQWRDQARQLTDLAAELRTASGLLTADIGANPLPYLLIALGLLVLLTLRLRAPRQLRAISQRMGQPADDRFSLTLHALGWTLLLALPMAAATWVTGAALLETGARNLHALEAIGHALTGLAHLVLFTSLWRALLRPGGLALAHFGWPTARVRTLRRARPVAVACILPLGFTILLALYYGSDTALSTWGRSAIIVLGCAMAALTWLLRHRLLQPTQPGNAQDATANPQKPRLLMRLMGRLLPLCFIATAGLALGGYVYTGIVVLQALFASLTVVLAIVLIDGLLHRWLLLGKRRLLRQRWQEKNQQSATQTVDTEAEHTLPEPEPELNLVAVNAQTQRLLRMLYAVLLTLGLLWAWADVLPALLRLNNITLWHSTTTIAGKSEPMPITLMAVCVGIVLLLLTFSMARNLPGLLELALNNTRHISGATRYTLTTLVRYAIVITGCLLAFSLFGLRWGQLQWMAAALTVGLGFGLQEIFANFVSGLILLVERPFRVGDTITIGNLTGTVMRIHTRATTVLDYDNKEIVIPNKTFITGQVTNWTLSDNITRLTIEVGVAYGSDPEQVRQLLLDAALENPKVLRDPAPNAWFMNLGESTLDFELRIYVAALGDRTVVRNDLNRRITELLAQAGIAIAYPQMDLHLHRSVKSAS